MGSIKDVTQRLSRTNEAIKLLLCAAETPGNPWAFRRAELSQVHSLMVEVKTSLSIFGEAASDPELKARIAEYRGNVEQLGNVLPRVQAWLLAERSRLQHARNTLTSAQAWAAAQKATL